MPRKNTTLSRPYITVLSGGAVWVSFDQVFVTLTEQAGRSARLMIDATHLKAHRTAASLLEKELFPAISDAQKAD